MDESGNNDEGPCGDDNEEPSGLSLFQQLGRKSSTGSNQQRESGNTAGSQGRKLRGRPRKHAKLIEDDSNIELLGGTSKSNTENQANEMSSTRPVGDPRPPQDPVAASRGAGGEVDNQESQSTFHLDASHLSKQHSDLRKGQVDKDKDKNQEKVGQKRSKKYEAETEELYIEDEGAQSPENGSNVENIMSTNMVHQANER